MKYILFFSLMMAFAACRKDCGPVPYIVPNPLPVDTLPPNTITALKNGVGITWKLYGYWSPNYENMNWGFSSDRVFHYSNPDLDISLSHVPFTPGRYKLYRDTWPWIPAMALFAITDYDAVIEYYEADTTKNNYVIVEKVDTANLEVTGRFETVFAIDLPKASPSFADTVAFKNGRFRVKIQQ